MSKYGFYISGKSERVKRFIRQADGAVCRSVRTVISEYDIESDLKKLLEQKGIGFKALGYTALGKDNTERNLEFSNRMLRELTEQGIDYCFSFGSHILAGELLTKYRYRIINFHPSLLPMYPGLKAIDQAAGDSRTPFLIGNTAHFIDEGVDTGPVIMQSVIPLQIFEDSKDYDRILDLQIDMLNRLIEIIDNGCLSAADGKVRIKNADYGKSMTFPFWKQEPLR